MVFCVGLTGGIGCGKSTVARLFAEHGAAVIDTDAISHALTQANAVGFQAILKRFGTAYLQADGSLDRAKLRTLIFSDANAKQALESILHPLIYTEVRAALSRCTAPYALIVVPLLFETGNYLPLVQRRLVVDCTEAKQISRTAARSGFPEATVRLIMSQQISRAERLARADDIINNNNDLDVLPAQVTALHKQYLSLAAKTPPKS